MFLRKLSEGRQRFRRNYPQYWLDALVQQIRRANPQNEGLCITGTVLAILRNELLDAELIMPGINIVTDDGDIYYAQMAAGEAPADDMDAAASGLRLGSDNTTPTKADTDVTTFIAGTGHALDASYEQTDDPDSDNTGAGPNIITWRYSYLTSEGNAGSILEGAIVDNRTTPTAALTHFLFAAGFGKTSSDTLKVFVNHWVVGE